MKRASYRHGIEWIANNDSPGDESTAEQIAGFISSLLLADLFDVEPERVGQDVFRYRKKHADQDDLTR